MPKGAKFIMYLICLSIIIAGCANYGPAEIHYGEDQCDYCLMNIVDNSFGSQVVTSTGKVFKFDSIECMAAFVQTSSEQKYESSSMWVTDFDHPGTFVRVDSATIVFSENYNSPMGVGLLAFSSEAAGNAFIDNSGGRMLDWRETCLVVTEKWKL